MKLAARTKPAEVLSRPGERHARRAGRAAPPDGAGRRVDGRAARAPEAPAGEIEVWRSRDAKRRRASPAGGGAPRAGVAARGGSRARARAVAPTSRPVRAFSAALLLVGGLLLADAIATLVWQEPVTGALAARAQAGLTEDLAQLEAQPPDLVEERALAGLRGTQQRIAFLARALERRTQPGDAIGRIELPRIHKEYVVVKGSGADSLRKGPGSYDGVPLPGVPGTAAIAGHRTTYGAPFRELDKMRVGDRITVRMPYAVLRYRVERTRIVDPTDLTVLTRRRYDRLILSACHPLFSLAQRIVVFAKLESTQPVGLAKDLDVPPLQAPAGFPALQAAGRTS